MNRKSSFVIFALMAILIGGALLSKDGSKKKQAGLIPENSEKIVFYNIESSRSLKYEVRVNDLLLAQNTSSMGNLIQYIHPGENIVSIKINDSDSKNTATSFKITINERAPKNDGQYIVYEAQPGVPDLVSYVWDSTTDKLPVTVEKKFQTTMGIPLFLSDKGEILSLTNQNKKEVLEEATLIHKAFTEKDIDTIHKIMTPIYRETEQMFNDPAINLDLILAEITKSVQSGEIKLKPVSNKIEDYIYTLYGNGKIIHIKNKSGGAFLESPTEETGNNNGSASFELFFSKIDGKWVWVR